MLSKLEKDRVNDDEISVIELLLSMPAPGPLLLMANNDIKLDNIFRFVVDDDNDDNDDDVDMFIERFVCANCFNFSGLGGHFEIGCIFTR